LKLLALIALNDPCVFNKAAIFNDLLLNDHSLTDMMKIELFNNDYTILYQA